MKVALGDLAYNFEFFFALKFYFCLTQGIGPSGEGLGFEGLFLSKFKVQYLMGANYFLELLD